MLLRVNKDKHTFLVNHLYTKYSFEAFPLDRPRNQIRQAVFVGFRLETAFCYLSKLLKKEKTRERKKTGRDADGEKSLEWEYQVV